MEGPAVAAPGLAIIDLALEALQLVVEDDVDDARHGIRAVGRRGAAGDRLDAPDHHRGDEVEVDLAAGRGGNEAPAVHQDQGARAEGRIEAAQIGEGRADIDGEAVGRGRIGLRRDVLGDQANDVLAVRPDQILHQPRVDDRQRHGGIIAVGPDPRSGDEDVGGGRLRRRGGARARVPRLRAGEDGPPPGGRLRLGRPLADDGGRAHPRWRRAPRRCRGYPQRDRVAGIRKDADAGAFEHRLERAADLELAPDAPGAQLAELASGRDDLDARLAREFGDGAVRGLARHVEAALLRLRHSRHAESRRSDATDKNRPSWQDSRASPLFARYCCGLWRPDVWLG